MHLAYFKYQLKAMLLFCFLMVVIKVTAQGQEVSGMVTGHNGRLSGASIHNLNSHAQCTSDIRGIFNIKTQKGDTLLIADFNYKTDTIICTGKDYLVVQLRQAAKLLTQVDIKDTLVSPLKAYNQNKKEYSDIYWKGDKSKMVTVSGGIGSAGIDLKIDKLYSAVSKQGKDARRLQRTLTRDFKNSVVDQRFNKNMVGKVTGYKARKLEDFMARYRPTYEFISKVSDYDLIAYTRNKFALDLKPGTVEASLP